MISNTTRVKKRKNLKLRKRWNYHKCYVQFLLRYSFNGITCEVWYILVVILKSSNDFVILQNFTLVPKQWPSKLKTKMVQNNTVHINCFVNSNIGNLLQRVKVFYGYVLKYHLTVSISKFILLTSAVFVISLLKI